MSIVYAREVAARLFEAELRDVDPHSFTADLLRTTAARIRAGEGDHHSTVQALLDEVTA